MKYLKLFEDFDFDDEDEDEEEDKPGTEIGNMFLCDCGHWEEIPFGYKYVQDDEDYLHIVCNTCVSKYATYDHDIDDYKFDSDSDKIECLNK